MPLSIHAAMDYGDAPFNYPTLMSDNGARHELSGAYLGAQVDDEGDGQPNADATGDDTNGLADEDGVTFPTALVRGQWVGVRVVASTDGRLSAWIDFNGDGDWRDADEDALLSIQLHPGTNSVDFDVPVGAIQGWTFSRFRFTTYGINLPDGYAYDGEVEDYRVFIWASQPPPVLSLSVVSNGWPVLSLNGSIGITYELQWSPIVGETNTPFQFLTKLTLTNNPQHYVDTNAFGGTQRFYRARSLP